jgi:hypothetical protein
MDRAVEEEHLRKAEANIAQGRDRTERQTLLVARLEVHGHDVTAANSVLQTMRQTLAVMEDHRRLILSELRGHQADRDK